MFLRVFTIIFILALLLLAITPLFEENNFTSPSRQQPFETQRFQAQGIQKIEPFSAAPLMHVNSIGQGEEIKRKLNRHPSILAVDHNGRDKSHFIDNQVTVKFKKHLTPQEVQQIVEDIHGKMLKQFNSTYIFSSQLKNTKQLIAYFEKRVDVEFAEPNYILMQNQQPNDMFYQQYQWNLPAIGTETGWNITRGSEDIIIAVVDTGVDLEHPDLKHRLAEGYNTLAEDQPPSDDNGHGTHVAGIIASETNNGEGVAGITWYNPIMPIKVMGAEGYGTAFDIANGIIWAADHGADVINMSLGNYQPSAVLKEAIEYAYAKDVVLIAATGNDNTSQPGYPAAYPEVLGVSAIDWNGQKADFSNYGDYVDVVAPGVEIASTFIEQNYAALSGTSMASPHVAALAGLIRSINPELKNTEVMDIIKNTAYDLGTPGKDSYYGLGLIDITSALEVANRGNIPLRQRDYWFDRFFR